MTDHERELRRLVRVVEDMRPLIKERRGLWDIPGMHGAAVAFLVLIDAQRELLRTFIREARSCPHACDAPCPHHRKWNTLLAEARVVAGEGIR